MRKQVNEIKISYKDRTTSDKWIKINSSQCAATFIYDYWDKDTIEAHESFKVLLLNNSNKVKGVFEISKGGITGTLVDLRLLLAVILKSLSVGIIITHNHPSGTLKPSESDKAITQKIKTATGYFDIKVLDHIIIAPNAGYFSFADEGLI
ncbi:JAB domain-containing protein [Croceitalea sp. MTPC5]|uniref:JAB domain-containing protein n=1 Tax=Croceitalea sp. MTPC5 TaxID=3056565 RepID=UPI002B3F47EA|nr:JAB domain-containing protein [Croceitalea sp. MTPC5]